MCRIAQPHSGPPQLVTLPADLVATLEQKLGTRIAGSVSVSGGCISETARLDLQNGDRLFMKWAGRQHIHGLFRAEAISLAAIATTRTVRVPRLVDFVDETTAHSFLLLEWLDPGPATTKGWKDLGRSLAELHQHRGEDFGWNEPNFIGSLPQSNTLHTKWADFWRAERLLPQLESAHAHFNAANRARFDKLLDGLDNFLTVGDEDGASLLHGDLWNGNVHMLVAGSGAVIDPSSYYGHREVDLAMSKLFGGFAREFYSAYEETWPLEKGAEKRLLIYQLYYLLVHVNLFGGSYVPNTLAVMKQIA
jgi:protein-ribulosamine 3-kinase